MSLVSYRNKAIHFCNYVKLIYEDEPIKIDFIIDELIIKFFLYYNNETFQDVEDFIHEIDRGLGVYFNEFYYR